MDWIRQNHSTDEAFQIYYSNIMGKKGQLTSKKMEFDDLIPFPKKEESQMHDQPVEVKNQAGVEGTTIVQKLHKGIPTVKNTSKIAFSNIYNNKFKYIVTNGNNSKLIRDAMRQRSWWVEIPNVDSAFNFKWQPVSYRMKFRDLDSKSPVKKIVNHFENHR